MATFAIDKKINERFPETLIRQGIFSSFQYQAPQVPENKKSRMIFTDLVSFNESETYPDVELYLDPKTIQVSKPVIQRQQLTKGGFVIQFWGHQLTKISVNAATGNFQPLYGTQFVLPSFATAKATESWFNQVKERWMKGGGPLKIFSKFKEWAFQNRFNLDKPYEGRPIIKLIWEDYVYKGFFSNFNYNLDSSIPFNINFTFEFIILKREDWRYKDTGGTIPTHKLIGDPINTISNKVKQETAVVVSYGKKQLKKLGDKSKTINKILENSGILEDVPDKITLW